MGKLPEHINALLIGTNGTGKSTLLKQIAQASNGRVLAIPSNQAEPTFKNWRVIQPHEVPTFTGKAKIMVYNQDQFAALAPMLRDLTLVSDDFRNYIKANTHEAVRKFFIDRRHVNVNIYMACHSYRQVPPEFFTFLSHIFLFRTTVPPNTRKNDIINYEAVEEATERVNRIAKTQNPYYYEIIPQ